MFEEEAENLQDFGSINPLHVKSTGVPERMTRGRLNHNLLPTDS